MIGRRSQKHFRALCALEPQVRVVIPGEADATMDLDGMNCRLHIGISGDSLGQRRQRGDVAVSVIKCGGGIVCCRFGKLDFQKHVGSLVLERLERSYWPAELNTEIGIINGRLAKALSATNHFIGQAYRSGIERLLQRHSGGACFPK